ncbi:hypothetical protein [Clostridium butyricum]|uniref:hypothetical protein n=1 Tax=Clostridium butyricum TaxID=1492 RepID=UPI0002C9563C|nr:hypothetical protein [Clostridium butyricum]EMU52823.1 hypothetical protein CBDKU1_31950 [Clostridium butyricum DKU-01]
MNSNFVIQKLSSNKKYIFLEDNTKVELPTWIKNRYSSLRFITDTNTLQIQCYKCKEWLNIALLKDNDWVDIHKDCEIRLRESGFSSYCSSCSLQKEDKKNKPSVPPQSRSATTQTQPISDMEKDTIFLTAENLKYVKLRLALGNMRKADFYNYLIEEEKEKNPISKFL